METSGAGVGDGEGTGVGVKDGRGVGEGEACREAFRTADRFESGGTMYSPDGVR